MDTLIKQFWDAGLIQFGRFDDVPFKLHFDLLPSYPDIWANVLERLVPALDLTRYERFLAPTDSLPLATLFSFLTNVPLVYSRGSGREGVYDLAGAYDVGHPTLFIANQWRGKSETHDQLIAKAGKVGLVIESVCVIMMIGTPTLGYPHHALFYLGEVVNQLTSAGKLPQGQAHVVMQWLAKNG